MILSNYHLGRLEFPNRMVMAPMTRARAVGDGLPHPAAATYYAQRASAGLIVTEGTQISHQARGYTRTPGIHTAEQVASWRGVTDAVHQAGGRIFLQLWHVGRVSHPDFQDGQLPIGASEIAAEGDAFTEEGPKPMPAPRALETGEMASIIEQYRRGAENAKLAGFDGVELHGANGYLLDQFIRDGSNQRADAYGGGVANRARLPLEVAQAVANVWGPERVGYRVSPAFSAYSMSDTTPAETFGYLAEALGALGLGYLHVVESIVDVPASSGLRLTPMLKRRFGGTVIANGGFDQSSADAAVERGEADLVAFGAPFVANPDLPARYRLGAPLNPPDLDTFYQGEERGYITYPALEASEASR